MKQLEEYPRVVVVQSLNHDEEVAWVRPYALINEKYTQRLADDVVAEYGVQFTQLLSQKGLGTTLRVGDAFRTVNLQELRQPKDIAIIGEYLSGLEPL